MTIAYQDEPQPEENDTAMLEDSNISASETSGKTLSPPSAMSPADRTSLLATATDRDSPVVLPNKKYPPLPEPVDLLADTFAEPPDMGPAVAGDIRPIYSILCMLPDVSTKTSKKNSFAAYDQEPYDSEIAVALQKEKEEMENPASLDAEEGENKSTKKQRTDLDPAWNCACGGVNANDESKCLKCDKRKSTEVMAGGWGDLFPDQHKNQWKCGECDVHNNDDKTACLSCETARPDKAGSSSAPAPAGDKPATGGAISSSGFTFGGASTSSTATDNKSKESSSLSTGGFTFSAAAAPAASSGGGFSFGRGVAPAPAAPSAAGAITGDGFTFFAPAPSPAPAMSNDGCRRQTSPHQANVIFHLLQGQAGLLEPIPAPQDGSQCQTSSSSS